MHLDTLHTRTFLTSILVLFINLSLAQSGVGVSPPRVEFQSLASTELNQEIIIDNPGNTSTLDVIVSLNDVLIQPDGSILYLDPGSHPNSLMPWLSISDLQFELAPETSNTINYTLNIPEGTADGTYWGILFFESDAAGQEETGEGISVRSRVRIGHVIYAEVGQVNYEGQIDGIRYSESGIKVSFRNAGTGLLRPTGTVEVRTKTGDLVHSLEVGSSVVFPGYSTESTARFAEPLESGEYVVLAVFDYGEGTLAAGEGRINVP